MGVWLVIDFLLIALLSTWMTATAIGAFRDRSHFREEMSNLFEQVFGSVRSGDLPRAILLLEGEPGPLASILSSILTEATKFTPKLRVAYKVTLESMRRRSQVRTNPLRAISIFAPMLGILAFVSPIVAAATGGQALWTHALMVAAVGVAIGAVSYLLLVLAQRQIHRTLDSAGEFGRKLLAFLLSPDSPLQTLRGRSFPSPE